MTRALLSMRMLVVLGASALVACGPRLKPVEYEEPKLSGSGAPDDSEPSGSHASKSSKSSSDSSDSSSSGSTSGGNFKSCDEKTACGTPCTECAPGNLDCMEVLIDKQCNLEHKCVAAPANCTAPAKGDKKSAKAKKE